MDDFAIGNLPDAWVEEIAGKHPDVRVTIHFRRFNGLFAVLVFDRNYSAKEPIYSIHYDDEEFERIAGLTPGQEFWREATTNEERLKWLIEQGYINT